MDRNIVNYQFLKSTAQTIFKIATQAYIKDLTSYTALTKKNKKKAKDHETQDGTENIFSVEEINKSILLLSATLLKGLLKKGFTCKPSDILQLQISDLKIRDIYDQVEQGKTSKFLLINKILYKKTPDNAMILVVPELLGEAKYI